jgi:hypothetical protein
MSKFVPLAFLALVADGADVCDMLQDVQCYGDDLKNIGVVNSYAECCQACQAETGCNALTWNAGIDKVCWLKSACSNKQTSSGNLYQSGIGASSTPSPPAPAPPSPPTPSAPLFPGRCGLAVTDGEAQNINQNSWLDIFQGSIGFWYNWNDASVVTMHASGKVVPFLPMWWGSQAWDQHPAQKSWCSNAGNTSIPAEAGPRSIAFAWNEPLGGNSCTNSMGACPGGDYSGADGAARAANNYNGCYEGASAANRLVSTPCLNNIDPDWFRAFQREKQSTGSAQSQTVCCSHIYASQYNNAGWTSCEWNAMMRVDDLHDQLLGLANDGTCDYHFIQEIGIGGCASADHSASEALIKNLGDAVRDIPSVYVGWFSNSEGDGGTSRKTTWLFEENANTIGKAYQDMCASLQSSDMRIAFGTSAPVSPVGFLHRQPSAQGDVQANRSAS